MKDLENLGVVELRSKEMNSIDGVGCSSVDYWIGGTVYCCTTCDGGSSYSCCL